MTDVARQRPAASDLPESEYRFQLLADAAPFLIWVCDASNRPMWLNRAWLEFTGQSLEHALLEPAGSRVHPEDAVQFATEREAALAGRRPFVMEYRSRRADGTYRWLLDVGTPRVHPDASFAGYVGSCVDITERKAAETTTSRLAAIIESSDDAIVSKGLDGVIASWNHAAERLFGYTPEEAIGRHISLLIPQERLPEEDEVLARIRRGEKVDHFETERQAKDGRRLQISLTVSPVKDGSGRIVGASKVARDITEQKRTQREHEGLLASERHARAEAERAGRLKDEFLATLSHELRTPLTAILGWIQILQAQPLDLETLAQGLLVIDRNARAQAQLIADILDMSSIVSGKMRVDFQAVDLPAVIERALETMRPAAHAKGIELTCEDPAGGGVVHGDPTRIQQMVWNLVSNAVKFTPPGGRVSVALKWSATAAEISVTDTGKGIRPDFLPYVFERFRQADSSTAREYGGLGLGLSIVKQLVELHGGTARAASPGEGEGSTFTLVFPVASRPLAHPLSRGGQVRPAAANAADRPELDLQGIRVLVVDDENDSRELIRIILHGNGADVVTANSVDQAVAAIEQDPPDVILSDIGMPARDGYEFMRRLRRLGVSIPAAAVTAFARPEDRARALEAGYQAHLSKPLETATIVQTVAALARGDFPASMPR